MLNEKWSYTVPEKCIPFKEALSGLKINTTPPVRGKRMYSSYLQMPFRQPQITNTQLRKVPDKWSWRRIGTNKIEQGIMRNQGEAGGSWAFSLVSALGDRYGLKYNIETPYPSSLWVLSLLKDYSGGDPRANKGNVFAGAKWLEQYGTKLESCWPYALVNNHDNIVPNPLNELSLDCCFNCCGPPVKGISNAYFSCKPDSTKYIVSIRNEPVVNDVNQSVQLEIDPIATINAIQAEIIEKGPVVTTFAVYSDFDEYLDKHANLGEIYIRNSNKLIGAYSAVISGWGQQNGINYWEVKLSFGNIGDDGYCKLPFSTSIPQDKWIYADVPSYTNYAWYGGVVAFEPGVLTNKNLFKTAQPYQPQGSKAYEYERKLKEESEKEIKDLENKIEKPQPSFWDNKIVLYIGIGIAILLVIILIVVVIRKKPKPQSIINSMTADGSYRYMNKINMNNIQSLNEVPVKTEPVIVPYELKANVTGNIKNIPIVAPF